MQSYFQKLFPSYAPLSKKILYGAGVFVALFVSLTFLYALILIPFTPGISDLKKARVEQPSVLLSSDGKELMQYKRFNREWIDLERISPSVVEALIATE